MLIKKTFPVFLFGAAICVCMISCKPGNDDGNKENAKICVTDSMANLVKIDSARLTYISDEVKLSGEVSFNDNKVVKVFPFSSGQVIKVMVSLGDKVHKGQTLAIIKSADVSGNYSDLSLANTDVTIAKKQLDNTESLFKNGIASEREYTEAKENYNKAVANAAKLKTQISINGGGQTSTDGTYTVKAPIEGYVVDKNAEEGSFIRGDNSQAIFTVGDINDVWIWANVYESDVAKVKEGYNVDVTTVAWPGKVFKGKIDKVNQVLDPQAKVMKVRIALNNSNHELKPEMFANVLVQNKEQQQMVTISHSAVITENGKNFVIIYHDKCNLELKQIEILKSVGDNTFVLKGLQPGDRIITEQQILYYRALIGEY
ncbi:MAG: efflux RND transporter periplasmic adaptor subunit [Bacteroidota bacterium]|nr:efflux RND transporter periplasmic adaptor subunit [Bacteroidota bacterium]